MYLHAWITIDYVVRILIGAPWPGSRTRNDTLFAPADTNPAAPGPGDFSSVVLGRLHGAPARVYLGPGGKAFRLTDAVIGPGLCEGSVPFPGFSRQEEVGARCPFSRSVGVVASTKRKESRLFPLSSERVRVPLNDPRIDLSFAVIDRLPYTLKHCPNRNNVPVE